VLATDAQGLAMPRIQIFPRLNPTKLKQHEDIRCFSMKLCHSVWDCKDYLLRRTRFGHGLDLHVAPLPLPLVVLFQQDGPDKSDNVLPIGEDADWS